MSNIAYNDKITPDGLIGHGWVKVDMGKDNTREIYRLRCPYYPHYLQLELMDFPKDNGNSGVLAVYYPVETFPGYSRKNTRKKLKPVVMPELNQNIAWGVNTWDRLHKVVTALTHTS